MGMGTAAVGVLLTGLLGAVVFGRISDRLSVKALLHFSIVGNVISTLFFLILINNIIAFFIFFFYGLCNMFAVLTTLDVIARSVPTSASGTLFASIMSIINLSALLSHMAGGAMNDRFQENGRSSRQAFSLLVVIGASFSALNWLVLPALLKHNTHLRRQPQAFDGTDAFGTETKRHTETLVEVHTETLGEEELFEAKQNGESAPVLARSPTEPKDKGNANNEGDVEGERRREDNEGDVEGERGREERDG